MKGRYNYRKMKKLANLAKTPYLKSILVLSGGSLIAQGINFICSLIMTRQYPKVAIGNYSYILSIIAMFSTVINARYDVRIVSAKDEHEVYVLIKLCICISSIVSVVVTVGAYLYGYISHQTQYQSVLWWIMPHLIVLGLINVLNAYNNRHGEYKLISGAYLTRTGWQSGLMVGTGFISPVSGALLGSQLVGQLFGVKMQSKELVKHLKEVIQCKTNELKTAAVKYKDQPLFSVPASFVNALSYSLIGVTIGSSFGMEVLALYAISDKVLGLPLGIFSSNIAKVHFKEANLEIAQKGSFEKSTVKMMLFSSLISICMVAVLMIFAPKLFMLLYGNTWRNAGMFVRILVPMFGLRLIVGAVGFTFVIANKQKLEFVFQIMLLVSLMVVSIIRMVFRLEITSFLTAITIAYAAVYMSEIITIVKISRRAVKQ